MRRRFLAAAVLLAAALLASCGGGGNGRPEMDGRFYGGVHDALVRMQITHAPGRGHETTRIGIVSETFVRTHPEDARSRLKVGTSNPFMWKVVEDEFMGALLAELDNQGWQGILGRSERADAAPHHRNTWVAVTTSAGDRGARKSELNRDEQLVLFHCQRAVIEVYRVAPNLTQVVGYQDLRRILRTGAADR